MIELKLCQGNKCHTYDTKDRLKGMKGSKTFQTRRRSSFYYGNGNFCSLNCQNDWFNEYGDKAIDHFGRLKEAKHLTEQNAWDKRENYYSWQRENNEPQYYFYNGVTKEQRPLTKQQYDDDNYTLNTI